MTRHDPINSPSHYAEGRQYEPIDVIHDWELGYNLGNVVKYVSRAGRKLDLVEDLKKARFYLNKEIEILEAVPFAVTYEDILRDQVYAASEGRDPITEYGLADSLDDTPFSFWDSDEDYMWDPSIGPVDLSAEEVSEILRNRDISNAQPDEILKVIEKRGMLIGVRKDGSTCVLNTQGRCE
jgi:hypothetical protein